MQKRLIENVDYFVRVVHFPNRSTPAQVWVNDDGTFDIYVDDLAADIDAAVAHELTHIRNDHFYDDIRPVANLEEEANAKENRYPSSGQTIVCQGRVITSKRYPLPSTY